MNLQAPPDPSVPFYWCFISYRHADNNAGGRDWASWLQREIERYDVPAELVGEKNQRGDIIPERIYPVFRDEESLGAHANLSSSIADALDRSRALVVLCSPRATESDYVAQEIQRFKACGKGDRIFAAIVAGGPGDLDSECFPLPLRHPIRADGTLDLTVREEPIAADFRLADNSEGFTSAEAYRMSMEGALDRREIKKRADLYDSRLQLMKLKIIAGILGVPLEKLRDRDKAYQLELARRGARTLRRWLAALGVLAVLALAGGIAALDQREEARREAAHARSQEKIASTERDREVIARSAANKVINTMLYDMREELLEAGMARLHDRINTVARDYFGSFPPTEGMDDVTLREHAAALGNSADSLLKIGKSEEALLMARESVRISEDLVERNPGTAGFGRDLATANIRLGWVKQGQGEPAAALIPLEKSMAALLKLHAETPSTENARLLAGCHEKLGAVKGALEGPAAALDHYQRHFDISTEIYALRQDLPSLAAVAYGHRSLGNAKMALEGPAAAAEHYRQSLEQFARIHQQQPSTRSRGDLAHSHERLGNVQMLQDERRAALASYERCHQLVAEIYEAEPIPVNLSSLIMSHERLGDIKETLEGPAAALEHFETQNKLAEQLYAQAPNPTNARSLAVSHQWLGNLQISLSNPAAALVHYQRHFDATAGLYARNATINLARDLAICHYKLATTKLAMADADSGPDQITQFAWEKRMEAKKHFEAARDILQELADAGQLDQQGIEWIPRFDGEAKKLE